MEFVKNKRKAERRKSKRLFGYIRRHQDKKESNIILRDTLIWLVCVSLAVSILAIMLFLGYVKG